MRLLAALGVLAALFASAPAHATPEFPGTIVSHFNIKCDGGANPIWDGNGCTICHLTNSGALGTVQHPFGVELKSMGLTPFNDNELGTLLDKVAAARSDVNCDGIPDIDELTSCEWPKLVTSGTACDGGGAGDGGVAVESVLYGGCSTSDGASATALPASIAALFTGMFVLAIVRRRRRA